MNLSRRILEAINEAVLHPSDVLRSARFNVLDAVREAILEVLGPHVSPWDGTRAQKNETITRLTTLTRHSESGWAHGSAVLVFHDGGHIPGPLDEGDADFVDLWRKVDELASSMHGAKLESQSINDGVTAVYYVRERKA